MGSILHSADFTELFLTKSSTRPSLLFAMEGATNNELLFFASHESHSQNEKSSLAAYSKKLKLPKDMMKLKFCGHASGLFCLRDKPISKKEYTVLHVICNPTTGQYGFLPKLRTGSKSFLGFDPIDKVFKVVSSLAANSYCADGYNILTISSGVMRWRRIQCSLTHSPVSKGICIHGGLYYWARGIDGDSYIVCFDVGSEKFKFIHKRIVNFRQRASLINYKGKLGVVGWDYSSEYLDYTSEYLDNSRNKFRIWVLEDDEKQDWSEYAYTLPGNRFPDVVGVTATGEIVLMENDYYSSHPFYVYYFHPGRNTVKRVEIEGFENNGRVSVFVDHVDDLTFNMKSHHLQQDRLRYQSINKFDALLLSEDV